MPQAVRGQQEHVPRRQSGMAAEAHERFLTAVAHDVEQQLGFAVVPGRVFRQLVAGHQVLHIGRVTRAEPALAVVEMVQARIAHMAPYRLAVRRQYQADEARMRFQAYAGAQHHGIHLHDQVGFADDVLQQLHDPLRTGAVARLEFVEDLARRMQHLVRPRSAGDAVRQHGQHVTGRTGTGQQGNAVVLLRAVPDVLRGSRFDLECCHKPLFP